MGNQRHLDGKNCFVVVVKITDLLVLQDVERLFRFVFVHLKIFCSVSCHRERVQQNFFRSRTHVKRLARDRNSH